MGFFRRVQRSTKGKDEVTPRGQTGIVSGNRGHPGVGRGDTSAGYSKISLLGPGCFSGVPFRFPGGLFLFVRKGELKGITGGNGSVSKGRNEGSIERERKECSRE